MPRYTYPDGGSNESQIGSPDIDSAELAARLNSVSRFRRSGRVIYTDDFTYSTGFSFQPTAGSWGVVAHQTVNPYSPPSCGKMTPGTGATLTCTINKLFPLIDSRKTGIELLFQYAAGVPSYLYINLTRRLSDYRNAGIRINFTGNRIEYLNSLGGYTAWATVTIPALAWGSLKIVFDWQNLWYSNLYWNQNIYNPPVSNTFNSTPGTGNDWRLSLIAEDQNATGNPVLIDDFIFTIDEP